MNTPPENSDSTHEKEEALTGGEAFSVRGAPRVVIVGRPNVGKSTLFNALAGRRVAIEDPTAGVTRDRVSFFLDVDGHSVELIDTGGIGAVDEARLKTEIDQQIATALDLADQVVFVIDGREGVMPADRDVADRLRRLDVPIILVASKVESQRHKISAAEGHSLGFGDPECVSARERLGIVSLRERLVSDLVARLGDQVDGPMVPSNVIRLAIVGRMNVGKSTFVNALVGEDRVIVSEVEGTTRDAVDVPLTLYGRKYTAIDTAGIRKRKTIADSVEFYSQSRAERAIRRADVVLLLVDATREIGRIDREIGSLAGKNARPCIIVVTKWDLAQEEATTSAYEKYLRNRLRGLDHAPIAFTSAVEALNLEATLELASDLHARAGIRISTGELNRVLQRIYEKRRPRPVRGRVGKVFYASQVEAYPPTLVLFVNDPALFEQAWRRYAASHLQAKLGFEEVPVRLLFNRRGRAQPDGQR